MSWKSHEKIKTNRELEAESAERVKMLFSVLAPPKKSIALLHSPQTKWLEATDIPCGHPRLWLIIVLAVKVCLSAFLLIMSHIVTERQNWLF